MTNTFLIKVGTANVLLKLNYLQSRVETQYIFIFTFTLLHLCYPLYILYYIYLLYYTNHIYHTKQNQTFYRNIKYDLLNFRGVNNGYHRDFQYLMVSVLFLGLNDNAVVKFYA